jgi:pimeloyl-ACP methyl ester carboxylesterase
VVVPEQEDPQVELRIIPGLGLDGRSWAPTLSHLRWPARVVALPAYGLPAGPDVDLSPAALAERAISCLAAHRPVVLAGHSSGCQVAAHVAARAPHLVNRVVLVGPTTDPRAPGWRHLAQRWLRTAAHEDPRQVPDLVRQYAATGLRVMARAMDAARRDRIQDTLGAAECPVLVVRGPDDRICPEDWATSLGRTDTLPEGGHMVPRTQGRDVAERIKRFVEDEGTRRPGPRL